MWQAMLMSAGIPSSKQVLVFGFLTINGEKISKSAGNSIDPFELTEKYGSDAVRYYLLSEMSPFEDGDYSEEKFRLKYNADLANGLGNLSARVSNLLEKNNIETSLKINLEDPSLKETINNFEAAMEKYKWNEALNIIWKKIKEIDETLSQKAPWKMDDKNEITIILKPLAQTILNLAYLLEPFIPISAGKIETQFSELQIKKGSILFPRLN